jgi:hypothetical protein
MTRAELDKLRRFVKRLRTAIDRARDEYEFPDDLPFINHWPRNCCDAPYLFLMLHELGHRGLTRKTADVSHYGDDFGKHVWIVLDEITIDITADQFPDVSDKVIVSRRSEWHDALTVMEERPWALDSQEELYDRYVRWGGYWAYEKILPQYLPPL